MKTTVKNIIAKLRSKNISQVTKWSLSEILNDLEKDKKISHSDLTFLTELCKSAGFNTEYKYLTSLN